MQQNITTDSFIQGESGSVTKYYGGRCQEILSYSIAWNHKLLRNNISIVTVCACLNYTAEFHKLIALI